MCGRAANKTPSAAASRSVLRRGTYQRRSILQPIRILPHPAAPNMTFPRLTSRAGRAAEPFNSKDANVILRSSDDVEFRVHRQVLALASPVLAALISRSSAASTTSFYMEPSFSRAPSASGTSSRAHHRKRPILDLPHASATLDLFLRFIYPVPEPSLTLDDVATLLELAEKYDAQGVTKRMRTHLLLPEHLEHDPTSVYALASHAGMADVVQIAARRTLALSLPARDLAEVRFHSGTALMRLLEYRTECGMAVADVVRVDNAVPWWVLMEWRRLCFLSDCSECAAVATRHNLVWHKVLRGCVDVPRYWVEYMQGVSAALQKRLDPSVARDPALVRPAVEAGLKCSRCAAKIYWDMEEFAKLLEEAIEEAISLVSIDSPNFLWICPD